MADSPSPVPESGLELETTSHERADWRASAELYRVADPDTFISLLDEIDRLLVHRDDLVCDLLAHGAGETVQRDRAESAEASAREAWAELSKERLERRIVEETAKRDRRHMERFKASARSARAEALGRGGEDRGSNQSNTERWH